MRASHSLLVATGETIALTGESIIYFAKEWGEVPTSCDQVFKQLARRNKVMWVNSISMRKPRLSSARDVTKIFSKLRMSLGGLRQVGLSAWVYQPFVIPLPHSETAQKLNRWILRWSLRRQARKLGMRHSQLWTFLPNVSFITGHLDESLVVYYCVDAWSEFSYLDGARMAALEKELLERADLCFATAHSLVDVARRHNPNTFLALHGVDYAHFSKALDPATMVPEDLARLSHPVIGFYGALHEWLDFPLLVAIARAHPEWSLALIGKLETDVSLISNLPNVHLLDRRPYETLPAYSKGFDVAIIPFQVNELTRNVNPIKLREYLSAGLPVVSTELPEVRRCGVPVCVASDRQEFIAGIEHALREDSAEQRRRRSESMRGETWEARVDEIGRQVLRIKASKASSKS